MSRKYPIASTRTIRRASEEGTVFDAYREAMSHLAATVSMVTTTVDERPWGLTISSCCSVSVAPPTVLISVATQTASAAAIRREGRFGLSILGRRGREAALAGSVQGTPKFLEEHCLPDQSRTPIVRGALAHLDCSVIKEIEVVDHTVFFGEVDDVIMFKGERPLLYYARDYAFLEDETPWWS